MARGGTAGLKSKRLVDMRATAREGLLLLHVILSVADMSLMKAPRW